MENNHSSTQSNVVERALYKLSCQWNVDSGKMFGKREQLEKLLNLVGQRRFERGIENCIENHKNEFCPSIAMIAGYVPAGDVLRHGIDPEEYERLSADRKLHPVDYFGGADVICMMRAQQKRFDDKKPLYTPSQVIEIIGKARSKYGVEYAEVYKPKPQPHNSEDYEVTSADEM
jgi:hypothetical protein